MPQRLKLTDKHVIHAKPASPGDRYTLLDLVVPGLGLRVTDKGAKSWTVAARIKGAKMVRVTLGTYPALSLTAARDKARDVAEMLEKGEDPRRAVERERLAERRRQADTFDAVARDFIKKHLAKNRTGQRDAKLIERDLIPEWGALPITEIRRRDVSDVLDKLAVQTTGKAGRKIGGGVAANRRLSTIRKIFNWALSRGIVEANPAARMERIGEEKARQRVLSDPELRWIWKGAAAMGGPFGGAVQLLMLTGQRRSEVGRMRRALVDTVEKRWTIPAEDAKNKREHVVPLSEAALAVIEGLPQSGGPSRRRRAGNPPAAAATPPPWLVTTTGKQPISGWSKFKKALDGKIADLVAEAARKAGIEARPMTPWALHDLRRTCSTGLARLGVPRFVVERILNHTDRSVTGEHYDRYEYLAEKRAALDRWARHVELIVDPPAGNVVELRPAS